MLRLLVMLIVALACIGGGAVAGLAVFASEFSWPLSNKNLKCSLLMGAFCGFIGTAGSVASLAYVARNWLWVAALIAVAITWVVSFVGVWMYMIAGLG